MKPLLHASPMEARSKPELPTGVGWWFEPKWDGFRCLAFKADDRVELVAKSGKSLNRFFPEVVERLAALPERLFGLDGELLARDGDAFSFEVLQARLHPAESRIRRLSTETPGDLRRVRHDRGWRRDRSENNALVAQACATGRVSGPVPDPELTLTPGSDDRVVAEGWLKDGTLEGVVAKRMDGPYLEGERAMVKVKRVRTADCVVGGFRYATDAPVVGSLLLGLYDDEGRLHHVGHTSGFAGIDKVGLTRELEGLRGGEGFTGRAPGGPSRWSTERSAQWEPLRPELVIEVSFDQVSDDRFRHGTRWVRRRPDKTPAQCRMEQVGG